MMKMRYSIILISLSFILIFSSCVSRKKLTYLQYSDEAGSYDIYADDTRTSVTPSAYKIMPYDNLFIRVITPDPQWSALFNIMPVGAGGAVTEESAGLFGYPVDDDGKIEIPFVGKVVAAGKTLSEIKVELDSIFKNYVTEVGNDNYFNNGIYRFGWTYYDMVIGTPLITSPAVLKVTDSGNEYIWNNKVICHHIGLEGRYRNLKYKLFAIYYLNFGTNSSPLKPGIPQYSFLLQTQIVDKLPWGISATLAVGLDHGEFYGNNAGIRLSLLKRGNF